MFDLRFPGVSEAVSSVAQDNYAVSIMVSRKTSTHFESIVRPVLVKATSKFEAIGYAHLWLEGRYPREDGWQYSIRASKRIVDLDALDFESDESL